jgi:predicted transcriptional regulator
MSYARKYKFWDWISTLPRQQRSQRLNELAAAVGVSRRTLNTWVDAELGASLDVSFEAVLTISRQLGQDPLAALNVAPIAAAA